MATTTTTPTLSEISLELNHWDQNRAGENEQNESIGRLSRELSDPEGRDVVIQQLLPADGGAAAWRLLIAAFVFEALLWGMWSIVKALIHSIC